MSECHASHSGSSDDTGTLSFFQYQYDQKCAVMTRVMIHHKTFFTSDACLAWQTMAMKSECVDVRFAGHAPLNRSEREKKKSKSRRVWRTQPSFTWAILFFRLLLSSFFFFFISLYPLQSSPLHFCFRRTHTDACACTSVTRSVKFLSNKMAALVADRVHTIPVMIPFLIFNCKFRVFLYLDLGVPSQFSDGEFRTEYWETWKFLLIEWSEILFKSERTIYPYIVTLPGLSTSPIFSTIRKRTRTRIQIRVNSHLISFDFSFGWRCHHVSQVTCTWATSAELTDDEIHQ